MLGFRSWEMLFESRSILWALLIINGLGTIYGFIWYGNQLLDTPWQYLIFVPDSPTASGFFTLFILYRLMGSSNRWIESFAAVTSLKYGIWAVAMIVLGAIGRLAPLGESLSLASFDQVDWMLMTSHSGMALEALLFIKWYRFKWIHLLGIGLWTILNDFMDYIAGVHPYLPGSLNRWVISIGWGTFMLSLFCLGIFAYSIRYQKKY